MKVLGGKKVALNRGESGLPGQEAGLVIFGESVIDGEERQLQAVGDAQLIEDVSEVVLNSLLADVKFLGNILVRIPGHDRRYNFKFPGRESEPFLPRFFIRERSQVAQRHDQI